jgi:hypothetical protein
MPGREAAELRREVRWYTRITTERRRRAADQFGGGVTGQKFGDLDGQRAGLRGFLFILKESQPLDGK